MPTGYTAIIEEKSDLTFREFALRCARAFGACVLQRDEDIDQLPRVDFPSDYHTVERAKAEAKVRELRALSSEAARALFDSDVARATKYNEESATKCTALKDRYMAIRAQVAAWVPPTAQHEGLRKFMLEQIDMCRSDWTPYPSRVPTDLDEWLRGEIEEAERKVAYHAESQAKELMRYEERKAWIEALYGSFAP